MARPHLGGLQKPSINSVCQYLRLSGTLTESLREPYRSPEELQPPMILEAHFPSPHGLLCFVTVPGPDHTAIGSDHRVIGAVDLSKLFLVHLPGWLSTEGIVNDWGCSGAVPTPPPSHKPSLPLPQTS